MLRITLTSAAILISVTAANAQYGAPPQPGMLVLPGMGGNPNIYGRSFADDYNRYGEEYARQRAYDEPSPYQPYPTVTPHYDPYHPRTNNGTSYGDDDD